MNYYEILGIPQSATEKEIRTAFRKLSKEHHPDAGGDPEKFRAIQEAYVTLVNPEKRETYDYFDGVDIEEVRGVAITIFKAALAGDPDDIPAGIHGASDGIRGRIREEIRKAESDIRDHEKILKRIKKAPGGNMDFLGNDLRSVIENLQKQKEESERRLEVVNTAESFLAQSYEFSGDDNRISGLLGSIWDVATGGL